MRDFTVNIETRAYVPMLLSPELKFRYQRGSAHTQGGPVAATVIVNGSQQALYELLDCLRCPLTVYNPYGTEVWWGYIAAIVAHFGELQIGQSLDEVSNRVKVIYTYSDPDGRTIKGETAWTDNTVSINTYGRWERLESLGNSNSDLAAQKLFDLLDTLSWPVGTPVFGSQGIGGDNVTLMCRGWYSSLAATYYSRGDGHVAYGTNGGKSINIGQAYTSNDIGFEASARGIHDRYGMLRPFIADQHVTVSGSVSNNGTFKVNSQAKETYYSLITNAMGFDPTNDFICTALSNNVVPTDLIFVSGATYPSSNGYFWVATVNPPLSQITVTVHTIIHSGIGPTISVERGNGFLVDEPITQELPTTTVTLTTVGEMVGFTWLATGTSPWPINEISVRLIRVGAPTDDAVVELWSVDGSDLPLTLLDTASIASSFISAAGVFWYKFAMSGTVNAVPTTRYWVTVKRSGPSETENYYQLDIDETAGYTDGAVMYWDGAAWTTPVTSLSTTSASVPFSVDSKEETTTQIESMITQQGQFLAGTQILNRSNRSSYQFRDGRLRTLAELNALLATGTSAQKRLLATVTASRVLQVYEEPVMASENTVHVTLDNRWFDDVNTPLEPGVLPIGKWGEILDLAPEVALYTKISPFFIEYAEYDADRDQLAVTPRGAWSAVNLLGVRQG